MGVVAVGAAPGACQLLVQKFQLVRRPFVPRRGLDAAWERADVELTSETLACPMFVGAFAGGS